MKILKLIVSIIAALMIIYFLGPAPKKPMYTDQLPDIPTDPKRLISYIQNKEKQYSPIRPGNEAQIIWFNDSSKIKTEYAIVYLHGFSASHEEGNPVHRNLAKKYGMNLYLSRLADHGRIQEKSLSNFTADLAWLDAKEALAIGKILGHNVILISTSTGGTLSLLLAAHFKEVCAQVLMSPNIALKDPSAFLLNNPWGLQIARKVIGNENRIIPNADSQYAKYWDTRYRIEALVELEELVESSMQPALYNKINQATLLMYYYKDDQNQDQVVKVDAMKKMFAALNTPAALKVDMPVATVKDHILASPIRSHDIERVQVGIEKFFNDQLKIQN